LVPASEQEQHLEARGRCDGEFYMEFDEFMENFDEISICHVAPDNANLWIEEKISSKWQFTMTQKESVNDPQIIIKLNKTIGKCTLVVSMHKKGWKRDYDYMSEFQVYAINEKDVEKDFLDGAFFKDKSPVKSSCYDYYRDIGLRMRLSSGYYAIVPKARSYAKQNRLDSTNFLLRVFTDSSVDEKIIKKINEKSEICVKMVETPENNCLTPVGGIGGVMYIFLLVIIVFMVFTFIYECITKGKLKFNFR
jgi:hypothetical protein